MRYRLLQREEWDKLSQIMDVAYIPHPDSAKCAVCETEDGTIIGALFAQLAMHMEPLIITRPQARFDRLHEVITDSFRDNPGLHMYVFSTNDLVDRMAEHVGMKPMPFRVYEQEVK
jgi:hypothetical protein